MVAYILIASWADSSTSWSVGYLNLQFVSPASSCPIKVPCILPPNLPLLWSEGLEVRRGLVWCSTLLPQLLLPGMPTGQHVCLLLPCQSLTSMLCGVWGEGTARCRCCFFNRSSDYNLFFCLVAALITLVTDIPCSRWTNGSFSLLGICKFLGPICCNVLWHGSHISGLVFS